MNPNHRRILAAVALTTATLAALPSIAEAHHQLIDVSASCTDAGWSATYTVTADADRDLTWRVNGLPTPPETQADEIPFVFVIPMTLADSSSTFHADALWSNGTTDSDDAGIDQPSGCTAVTTTTTLEEPSTTTTTTSSTTTLAPTTSTSLVATTLPASTSTSPPSTTLATTTTLPPTSSSVAATSTTSAPPSPTATTTPPTVPPAPSSTTPETPCDAPPGTESDSGCVLPILPATL